MNKHTIYGERISYLNGDFQIPFRSLGVQEFSRPDLSLGQDPSPAWLATVTGGTGASWGRTVRWVYLEKNLE